MRLKTTGSIAAMALIIACAPVIAQSPPPGTPGPDGKPLKDNSNPCREEVATALKKLRSASWFRMVTSMITEKGPVSMDIAYVLPDKMHQKVTEALTKQTSEIVLVGNEAWGNDGKGWQVLPQDLTQQLKSQLYDNVIAEQTDVGNYSCKGKVQIEGRDVLAYKLEDEPARESTAPKNETFRMFYVDATTGMPVSNALLAPGRENTPMFKASYSYPVEIRIEAPKDVVSAPEIAPEQAAPDKKN